MQWIQLVLILLQPAQATSGPDGFDFFLGEWHASQRWLQEDMTYDAFTNRVSVHEIMQGHGIQDDNFKPVDGRETYFGSAMRIYDAENVRWICRWFDGNTLKLSKDFFLTADKDGFSGVIKDQDKHGAYRDHIRFFNISPQQFQWKMVRRYEGYDQDFLIGEITYTRVKDGSK